MAILFILGMILMLIIDRLFGVGTEKELRRNYD